MAKNRLKWDAAMELVESIYSKHKLDETYGRKQAHEDFDVYSYAVIDAACNIVDIRLRLADSEDMLPWE